MGRLRLISWALSLAVLLPLLAAKVAETPLAPGVQREQVNIILIDVVVTDASGRNVLDLEPSEFTLVVDGKPQSIESVELQCVGTCRGEARSGIEPPPNSGQAATLPVVTSIKRQFVLLFDGLNSTQGVTHSTVESSRYFLEHDFRDEDRAMVAGFGRKLKIFQEFTSDRDKLAKALDTLEVDKSVRLSGGNRVRVNRDYLDDMAKFNAGVPLPCGACEAMAKQYAQEDGSRTELTLTLLSSLVAYLHPLKGRKDLIYFSNGFAFDPGVFYGGFSWEPPSEPFIEPKIMTFAQEAASAQVVIYPVNVTGLTVWPLENHMESESSNMMLSMAEKTGGKMFHNRNRFDSVVDEITSETAASYVLAFVPRGNPDGKFHSVRVKVQRKGVTVRSKEGFVWMTGDQIQEREVLSAFVVPELYRNVPLALIVRTQLEHRNDAQSGIAISVPIEGLFTSSVGSAGIAELEVGAVLRPMSTAKSVEIEGSFRAQLPKELARDGSLLFVSHRNLPPGQYEGVAVVRDLRTDRIGATRENIEIPELSGDSFAMSTAALENRENRALRIDLDRKNQKDAVDFVPSIARALPRNETVLAAFSLYFPKQDEAGRTRVVVEASILRDHETLHRWPPTSFKVKLQDGAFQMPVLIPFSFSDFEPGDYVLRIDANDQIADRHIFQEMRITLE